jgi:hypothetical protein
LKGVVVVDRSPKEIAQVEEGTQRLHHLAWDMSDNSRKIDLNTNDQ